MSQLESVGDTRGAAREVDGGLTQIELGLNASDRAPSLRCDVAHPINIHLSNHSIPHTFRVICLRT